MPADKPPQHAVGCRRCDRVVDEPSSLGLHPCKVPLADWQVHWVSVLKQVYEVPRSPSGRWQCAGCSRAFFSAFGLEAHVGACLALEQALKLGLATSWHAVEGELGHAHGGQQLPAGVGDRGADEKLEGALTPTEPCATSLADAIPGAPMREATAQGGSAALGARGTSWDVSLDAGDAALGETTLGNTTLGETPRSRSHFASEGRRSGALESDGIGPPSSPEKYCADRSGRRPSTHSPSTPSSPLSSPPPLSTTSPSSTSVRSSHASTSPELSRVHLSAGPTTTIGHDEGTEARAPERSSKSKGKQRAFDVPFAAPVASTSAHDSSSRSTTLGRTSPEPMSIVPVQAPVYPASVPGTPVCKGYNSQGSCHATRPLVPSDFIGKANCIVTACSFCRRRRQQNYKSKKGSRAARQHAQSASSATAGPPVGVGTSRTRKTGKPMQAMQPLRDDASGDEPSALDGRHASPRSTNTLTSRPSQATSVPNTSSSSVLQAKQRALYRDYDASSDLSDVGHSSDDGDTDADSDDEDDFNPSTSRGSSRRPSAANPAARPEGSVVPAARSSQAPVYPAAPGVPVCIGRNGGGSCYATRPLTTNDFAGRSGNRRSCIFCCRRNILAKQHFKSRTSSQASGSKPALVERRTGTDHRTSSIAPPPPSGSCRSPPSAPSIFSTSASRSSWPTPSMSVHAADEQSTRTQSAPAQVKFALPPSNANSRFGSLGRHDQGDGKEDEDEDDSRARSRFRPLLE